MSIIAAILLILENKMWSEGRKKVSQFEAIMLIFVIVEFVMLKGFLPLALCHSVHLDQQN